MKYITSKISIIVVIIFTYVHCWGNEIITGRWMAVKSVSSTGYITNSSQPFKIVGNVFYLGTNYIKFRKVKYENLIQDVRIYSEDEIFEGWRIKLSDIGIRTRSAKILQYKVKEGDGYLPYSEFILAPDGSLIAITEYGLFKLIRSTP